MASPRTWLRPSSELVDDTIIDVLLRLPPEEPAHLVRASLVCKQWRRVVSDPEFLRLYVRVHRTPPLLGLFTAGPPIPCFIPTTVSAAAAGGEPLEFDHHCPWLVLDCRHGRVLLQRRHVADALLVWDPITSDLHELPWLTDASSKRTAVVLCASTPNGCDHSGCRGGPFLVICADIGIHGAAGWRARARVYSSQLCAWGAPVHMDLHAFQHLEKTRAVVIGEQVYLCRFFLSDQIIKYDVSRHCLSTIHSPGFFIKDIPVEFMATEEGLFALAGARRHRIHIWSMTTAVNNAETEGVAGWEQYKVIDLRMMMISSPAGTENDNISIIKHANVIGFLEGANAILVSTNAGTFVIDVNESGRARKISDTRIHNPVVPFVTFYSPGIHNAISMFKPSYDVLSRVIDHEAPLLFCKPSSEYV